MEISFKYGAGELTLPLPQHATELRHTEPEAIVDQDLFRRDIHSYLYSLNHQVKRVGISISDKTRLCEFPIYLPLITQALEEHGIARENITFFIAYGTHPRQSEEECLQAYGDSYRNYRFVHHDSRDEEQLSSLGRTTRGTEVKINKGILDNDVLITFGAILHHYFAGFGGGRKLFFPGLAAYDSILHNHKLFLDFEHRTLETGCQSGQLEGNPLAEDLEEINALLPDKLEIHGILNSQRAVCEIHFGLDYDHFMEACHQYDRYFRVKDADQYDLVIASAGGYPKDINYIQSHKSIHNAASFVKDGGTLLILAECRDGIGNQAFMDLFSLGGKEGIFQAMERQYVNNAGTALATLEKADRIQVHFATDIEAGQVEAMGYTPTTFDQAQSLVNQAKGRVAYIENSSILYR